MKKTMLFGLALGLVAFAATSASATIVNSKHDLSGLNATAGDGDPQGRICVFCHHPHNTVKSTAAGGTGGLSYSPLWNREYRDRGFIAYNNGTNMDHNASASKHNMNGTPAIGGVSLLCLSCHDGVTALNAFSNINPAGSTGSVVPGLAAGSKIVNGGLGNASFGLDLSNHHPIGMSWDDVMSKDDEIAAKTVVFNGTATTIGSVLTGGDTMECSSCHDVHNGTGAERFLWTSNQNGSKFCLTCHIK